MCCCLGCCAYELVDAAFAFCSVQSIDDFSFAHQRAGSCFEVARVYPPPSPLFALGNAKPLGGSLAKNSADR